LNRGDAAIERRSMSGEWIDGKAQQQNTSAYEESPAAV
jgi:hypothetical protein